MTPDAFDNNQWFAWLLEVDSHGIVEVSVAVADSVLRDDDRRIVVAVLDPVQHASNTPRSNAQPRRSRSTFGEDKNDIHSICDNRQPWRHLGESVCAPVADQPSTPNNSFLFNEFTVTFASTQRERDTNARRAHCRQILLTMFHFSFWISSMRNRRDEDFAASWLDSSWEMLFSLDDLYSDAIGNQVDPEGRNHLFLSLSIVRNFLIYGKWSRHL